MSYCACNFETTIFHHIQARLLGQLRCSPWRCWIRTTLKTIDPFIKWAIKASNFIEWFANKGLNKIYLMSLHWELTFLALRKTRNSKGQALVLKKRNRLEHAIFNRNWSVKLLNPWHFFSGTYHQWLLRNQLNSASKLHFIESQSWTEIGKKDWDWEKVPFEISGFQVFAFQF